MRIDLADPGAADITAAVVKLLGGHSKSRLAREIGVSRETLYRWERGDSLPDISEMQKIAKITGNEIRISLNPGYRSLENQIQDLRDEIERIAQELHRQDDPHPSDTPDE